MPTVGVLTTNAFLLKKNTLFKAINLVNREDTPAIPRRPLHNTGGPYISTLLRTKVQYLGDNPRSATWAPAYPPQSLQSTLSAQWVPEASAAGQDRPSRPRPAAGVYLNHPRRCSRCCRVHPSSTAAAADRASPPPQSASLLCNRLMADGHPPRSDGSKKFIVRWGRHVSDVSARGRRLMQGETKWSVLIAVNLTTSAAGVP